MNGGLALLGRALLTSLPSTATPQATAWELLYSSSHNLRKLWRERRAYGAKKILLPALHSFPHSSLCPMATYICPLCNLSVASAFKYFPGDRKDWDGGSGQPGDVVKNRWRKAPRRETCPEIAEDARFSPALNELITEGFNPSTSVPEV